MGSHTSIVPTAGIILNSAITAPQISAPSTQAEAASYIQENPEQEQQ